MHHVKVARGTEYDSVEGGGGDGKLCENRACLCRCVVSFGQVRKCEKSSTWQMRQQIFRWDAHKIMKNVRHKKAEPGPRAKRGGTPLPLPRPPLPIALPPLPSVAVSFALLLPPSSAAQLLLLLLTIFMQQQHQQQRSSYLHPLFFTLPLSKLLGMSCASVCCCIFATFHSFCFVISTRKQQTREGNGKRNKLRA